MRRFLLKLFRRRTLERDLESELTFHEEMTRANGNAIGLGNRVQVKEQARDFWRWTLLESLWRDVLHAARQFRRASAFSLATVLTLGLAIGANTAIFSIVESVVLNPLPYPESDRLIDVNHGAGLLNIPSGMGMKLGLYHYYRDRAGTLEEIAVYRLSQPTLIDDGEPERILATRTTTTLASVMGISPALGRWFSAEEGMPGAAPTAVISNGLFLRRYGGDAGVIGRSIRLDGTTAEIIGVMPAGFAFPTRDVDLWLPEPVPREAALGIWTHRGVARMRDDVAVSDVRAEIDGLIADVPNVFASDPLAQATSFGIGAMSTAVGLKEATIGDIESALWILLAAVGVVLLVAGANVANLFLVRAENRQREVSLRRALGAGSGGIARFFIAESLLLSFAGGLVGVILARWAVELVVSVAPASLPRIDEIRMDGVVLAFAAGLVLLTGVAFGSMPLWSRKPIAATLGQGGTRLTAGRGHHRMRQLLMGGQVALALVLLAVSGLMVKSFQRLRAVDPGFDARSTLTFDIGLPRREYPTRNAAIAAHHAILDSLSALPGVVSVSASTCLPLSGGCFGNGVVVEGRELEAIAGEADLSNTSFSAVGAHYFETMGIPLLRGRGIERADINRDEPIVIVDQTFADIVFPDEDPLGRRITWSMPPEEPGQAPNFKWMRIVGVVRNTPAWALGEPFPLARVYMPMSMTGEFGAPPWEYIGPEVATMAYAVRSTTLPRGLMSSVRDAVDSVDPGLAIARVNTLEERLDAASAQMAFMMGLIAIAASVALLLGLVGIYGVVSYIVSQRRNEIGIRLALGAAPGRMAGMIVSQGGLVTLGGIVVGLGATLVVGRMIESLLYDVDPRDPIVLLVTTVALFAVATLACWLPARRAARVNPIETLRAD